MSFNQSFPVELKPCALYVAITSPMTDDANAHWALLITDPYKKITRYQWNHNPLPVQSFNNAPQLALHFKIEHEEAAYTRINETSVLAYIQVKSFNYDPGAIHSALTVTLLQEFSVRGQRFLDRDLTGYSRQFVLTALKVLQDWRLIRSDRPVHIGFAEQADRWLIDLADKFHLRRMSYETSMITYQP